MVLSLENTDQIFEDLGRDGQQRLRNMLQAHPHWSVVATSRTLGPAFLRPQSPFFNTFAVHTLAQLDPVGCRDLLARLADMDGRDDLAEFLRTPTGLARVRAIHHFAGGNPRAMALLHPYLTRERLGELIVADALWMAPWTRACAAAAGVRQVFESLEDPTFRTGAVEVEEVMERYRAGRHPRVFGGEMAEAEARRELAEALEGLSAVVEGDLAAYYADVVAGYGLSDAELLELLRLTWGLGNRN